MDVAQRSSSRRRAPGATTRRTRCQCTTPAQKPYVVVDTWFEHASGCRLEIRESGAALCKEDATPRAILSIFRANTQANAWREVLLDGPEYGQYFASATGDPARG